jgi:hypothetical protein
VSSAFCMLRFIRFYTWLVSHEITPLRSIPFLQAGLSGDPVYSKLVDNAIEYAVAAGEPDEASTVSLAIDRLAVNLGAAISMIVPGYISTEVDPR